MTENEIATIVFNAALKVHKALGPGLLEKVYQECLIYELRKQGLFVESEKPIPIEYDDLEFDVGFRADIIVERKFIVETKATKTITDIDLAQLLTHLNLTNCKLGFVINFNVILLKDGVKRVINGYL